MDSGLEWLGQKSQLRVPRETGETKRIPVVQGAGVISSRAVSYRGRIGGREQRHWNGW